MQASEMGKETIFSRPRSDNTAFALMCVRKFGFFLFTFQTFISETNGMLDTLNSKRNGNLAGRCESRVEEEAAKKTLKFLWKREKKFYQRNSFVCWNVFRYLQQTYNYNCRTQLNSYLAYRAYQPARSRLCEHARFNTILLHRADTSEWTLETTSFSEIVAIWKYTNAYQSLYNRKQYVTQNISTSGHDLFFRSSRPGLERKWTQSIFGVFEPLSFFRRTGILSLSGRRTDKGLGTSDSSKIMWQFFTQLLCKWSIWSHVMWKKQNVQLRKWFLLNAWDLNFSQFPLFNRDKKVLKLWTNGW